ERAGAKLDAGLLSREATAAVGSAFNRLTETARKHEPTLEDVVRETLRPVLKSWLDENLPSVVERMVQAEIERVTRGRCRPQASVALIPFEGPSITPRACALRGRAKSSAARCRAARRTRRFGRSGRR